MEYRIDTAAAAGLAGKVTPRLAATPAAVPAPAGMSGDALKISPQAAAAAAPDLTAIARDITAKLTASGPLNQPGTTVQAVEVVNPAYNNVANLFQFTVSYEMPTEVNDLELDPGSPGTGKTVLPFTATGLYDPLKRGLFAPDFGMPYNPEFPVFSSQRSFGA